MGCVGEVERLAGVVGEHLGQVLDAPAGFLFEPGRGFEVLAGSLRTGDLAVGDVAYEQMPEAELLFGFHRGSTGGTDELLTRQFMQCTLDLSGVAITHVGERAGPEHLADHGGVLEQALAIGSERVETSRD